jgi:predicted alpha/beta-hydrolase family hydrolase
MSMVHARGAGSDGHPIHLAALLLLLAGHGLRGGVRHRPCIAASASRWTSPTSHVGRPELPPPQGRRHAAARPPPCSTAPDCCSIPVSVDDEPDAGITRRNCLRIHVIAH